MNFTITTIAQSLADYLSPLLPGVTFYEDPAQQGVNPPCWFLQQRYSYIEKQPAGFYLRRVGLDLTYIIDFNLPNMHQLYLQAAESLDLAMETFPYSDGETTGLIRTYDREWTIDLNELHYQFEIQARVTIPKNEVLMQKIEEYSQEVRD